MIRGMRAVIVFAAAIVLWTGFAPGGAVGAAPPTRTAPDSRAVCDPAPRVRWEGGEAELSFTRCATDARYSVSWKDPEWVALPQGNRIAIDRIPVTWDMGEYPGRGLAIRGVDAQGKLVAQGFTDAPAPFVDVAAMADRLGRDLAGRPLTTSEVIAIGYEGDGAASLAKLLIEAPYWQVQTPIVRLYRAAFLRLPDTAGLDYWVGRRRAGLTLAKAAAHFAGSAELITRYGALTDREFVEQIYENILGRPGEPAGVDYWTQEITSGKRSRGAVLLGFSESAEHRTRTADLVGAVNVVSGLLRRVPTSVEVATPATVASRIEAVLRSTEFTSRLGDVPPLPVPGGDAQLAIAGDVGYRAQLSAEFATGAVTYSVPSGSTLPAGLSLSPSGVLAGDPTPGTYTFRVAATDASGATGTNELHITVRTTRTGLDRIAGSCLLEVDGDVECSGLDTTGVAPATDLASGDRRTCAITGGTVRCWGEWPSGEVTTPTVVSGISTATQVSVGRQGGCVVLAAGTVSCWSDIGSGAAAPVGVTLPDTALQVEVSTTGPPPAGGDPGHTCARLDDGTIWCWGANGYGQLGNTDWAGSATPVVVAGVSGAVELAVNGLGGCALVTGGDVLCWGDDNRPGDGVTAAAVDAAAGATDISAEAGAACALLAGGTVTCWGMLVFHPSQSGAGGGYGYATVPLTQITGATALDGLGATLPGGRIRTLDPTSDTQGPWTPVRGPSAGWIFA